MDREPSTYVAVFPYETINGSDKKVKLKIRWVWCIENACKTSSSFTLWEFFVWWVCNTKQKTLFLRFACCMLTRSFIELHDFYRKNLIEFWSQLKVVNYKCVSVGKITVRILKTDPSKTRNIWKPNILRRLYILTSEWCFAYHLLVKIIFFGELTSFCHKWKKNINVIGFSLFKCNPIAC